MCTRTFLCFLLLFHLAQLAGVPYSARRSLVAVWPQGPKGPPCHHFALVCTVPTVAAPPIVVFILITIAAIHSKLESQMATTTVL
jgi:hypothetical protein